MSAMFAAEAFSNGARGTASPVAEFSERVKVNVASGNEAWDR